MTEPEDTAKAGDGTGGPRTGGVYDDPALFAAILSSGRALFGLDLGTKSIGVAVSDRMLGIASPLTVLRRTKFGIDAAVIAALVAEREITGVVIGLPRNMDGSEGPRAQSTRAFARNLHAALGLPVALWDERLSTVEAERALLAADTSRRRRAEVVDQVAAGIILQGFLDRLRHIRSAAPF